MALVIWSGGCDSTLVLHDVAKKLGSVRALSIQHPQVLACEESIAARERLLIRLRKRGLNIEHTTLVLDHGATDIQVETHDGCNPQAVLWLTLGVAYLRQDEDIYFGYHRGDDFWTDQRAVAKAFQALQWIRNGKGKISYPLEGHTKADIIKRLQALGLYRDCWYCEDPRKGKRCGKCRPCITHRTAVWQLSEGLA